MPDIWLSNDAYNRAQADMWHTSAQRQVADTWAAQTSAAVPSMVADAQDRADQAAAATRQQTADDWATQAQQTAMAALQPPQDNAAPEPPPQAPAAPPPPETAPEANSGQPTSPTAPVTAPLSDPTSTQQPIAAPAQAPQTATGDPVEAYIRQAAAARSIDPDVAARVYHGEGASSYVGDNGSSFGPFQLHYGGVAGGGNAVGGLGDTFTAQTGLDARDPSTWQKQVDWSLDQVARSGWGPWHGAAAQGITGMAGVGGGNPQGSDWQTLALSQLNKPYIWGSGSGAGGRGTQDLNASTSQPNGYDCSGYVAWVLKNGMGIDLPAQTASAYGKTTAVDPKDARPGDVVFYNMDQGDPHVQHMALYLGDGKIVEAGGVARNVNVADVGANGTPEFRRPTGAAAPSALDRVGQALTSGASSVASTISSGVQSLGDWLGQLGREPTDQELSGFLSSRPSQDNVNARWEAAQNQVGSTWQPPSGPLDALGSSGLGAPTAGEHLTAERNDWIAQHNPLRDVPFVGGATTLAAQTVADPTNLLLGAGPGLGKASVEALGSIPLRSPAEATSGFASGFDALMAARQAVADLARRFPDMSPGSLAASGAGKHLAELESDAAANPAMYAAGPTLEPEVAATLPPGSGPLAAAAEPLPESVTTQGLLNVLKARGVDTSWIEPQVAAAEGPKNVPAAAPPAQDAATLAGRLRDLRAQLPTALTPADEGRLPVNEYLPEGPQSGQLPLFGEQPLPHGGARPTAQELLGPGGPQPGQMTLEGGVAPYTPQMTPDTAGGFEAPVTAADTLPSTDRVRMAIGQQEMQKTMPSNPSATGTPATTQIGSQSVMPGFNPQPVSTWDKFKLFRMGNMISAPATVVKVALNSLTAPLWTLGRDAITLGRGAPSTIAPEFSAAFGSLGQAGANFLDALTTGSANAAGGLPARISDQLEPGLGRYLARVWEFPGNVHGALQEVASTIVAQAELGRMAAVKASAQGLKANSPEWWQSVNDLVANPTPDLLQAAQSAGDRAALRGDLGTLGSGVMKARNALGPFGDVFAPILKIPINDLTQTIEKSPLGLLGTGWDVARAAAGKGPYASEAGFAGNGVVAPLGERLANNVVGSAVTAFLAAKALDGSITGSGPDDSKQRLQLEKSGWQPHSINVPGLGYVSYDNAPPGLKEPLLMVGEYADLQHFAKSTDDATTKVGSYLERLAGQYSTAAGLQEAGQIYDLLSGAAKGENTLERPLARYAASMADSVVPYSAAVRAGATATDPLARTVTKQDLPGETADYFKQDVPGLREQVAPSTNLVGQPNQNPQQGLGVLLPRVGAGSNSATAQLLGGSGVTLGAPPKELSLPGGQKVPLSADEQALYERARGDALEQVAPHLLDNASFGAAPLKARVQVLQQQIARADQVAAARTLAAIGGPGIMSRLAAAPPMERPDLTLPTPVPARPSTSTAAAAAPSQRDQVETLRQQLIANPQYANLSPDQQDQIIQQVLLARR